MNDVIVRAGIRHALELIEKAADAYQCELNRMASAPACAAGALLRAGRTVDTLERCARDLAGLLDQPPRVDGAPSLRLAPDPQRRGDAAAG